MKLYVPCLPSKTNCALPLSSPIALPPELSYFCSPPLIVQPVELRHTLNIFIEYSQMLSLNF